MGNWAFSGGLYPDGPGDEAETGAGSVEIALGESLSVDRLAVSGGSLTGAGSLTLLGTATSGWSGGNVNGPGTLTVGTRHAFSIADGLTADYAGRQWVNLGGVTRTADSNLR